MHDSTSSVSGPSPKLEPTTSKVPRFLHWRALEQEQGCFGYMFAHRPLAALLPGALADASSLFRPFNSAYAIRSWPAAQKGWDLSGSYPRFTWKSAGPLLRHR